MAARETGGTGERGWTPSAPRFALGLVERLEVRILFLDRGATTTGSTDTIRSFRAKPSPNGT